jgi:hypothetical protein
MVFRAFKNFKFFSFSEEKQKKDKSSEWFNQNEMRLSVRFALF